VATFRSIKPAKTYAEIVDHIRHLITSGALKSTDKLPPERQLCVMLGTGRQSLRQALSVLEAMGVLETKHGIGTFIIKDGAGEIETIKAKEEYSYNPFELLEARKIIEPKLAALAAKRATSEDINSIVKAIQNVRKKMLSGKYPVAEDRELHLIFAKAAHNAALYMLMENVVRIMGDYTWDKVKHRSIEIEGRAEIIYAEHVAILQGIESGNARLAAKSMLTHLSNVENRFKLLTSTN